MKTILIFLAAVTAIITTQAHAEVAFLQRELLTQVQINGEQQEERVVGIVSIDKKAKEISLVVLNDICGSLRPSPPNTFHCMAMAFPIATLQVPLQKMKTDACGTVTYSGMKNLLPVDGAKIAIQVVDNRSRLCMDLVAGSIVVKATSETPRAKSKYTYYLHN